jgi:hypothetical protein
MLTRLMPCSWRSPVRQGIFRHEQAPRYSLAYLGQNPAYGTDQPFGLQVNHQLSVVVRRVAFRPHDRHNSPRWGFPRAFEGSGADPPDDLITPLLGKLCIASPLSSSLATPERGRRTLKFHALLTEGDDGLALVDLVLE